MLVPKQDPTLQRKVLHDWRQRPGHTLLGACTPAVLVMCLAGMGPPRDVPVEYVTIYWTGYKLKLGEHTSQCHPMLDLHSMVPASPEGQGLQHSNLQPAPAIDQAVLLDLARLDWIQRRSVCKKPLSQGAPARFGRVHVPGAPKPLASHLKIRLSWLDRPK